MLFSFYTHFFFGAILPHLCIKQNTRVIGEFFAFLINLHCKMMHVKCVYVLQFFLRGMYCLKQVKNIGHLRGCWYGGLFRPKKSTVQPQQKSLRISAADGVPFEADLAMYPGADWMGLIGHGFQTRNKWLLILHGCFLRAIDVESKSTVGTGSCCKSASLDHCNFLFFFYFSAHATLFLCFSDFVSSFKCWK